MCEGILIDISLWIESNILLQASCSSILHKFIEVTNGLYQVEIFGREKVTSKFDEKNPNEKGRKKCLSLSEMCYLSPLLQ